MSSVEDKIPEGWVETTLEKVCEITSSKRIFAKEYQTSGIPFFRGKEVTEKFNGYKVSTELFITKKKYDEIKSKYGVPCENDILLTSVGTLGNPYLVEKDFEFYFKDGNITWFKNFNNVDSKFLYHWIISPQGKENLSNAQIGSTQQAYTMTALKRVDIVLPKIEEQKAIAQVLTAFDDKIENLRAQNQTLETLAQTIFKEWFLPSRQAGGKYQVGDELPEGWKYEKLNYIAKHLKKSIKPSKNPEKAYVHYSLPAFDNGLKPIRENGIDIKSNKYAVVSSSFLVSKLNPFTPRIWTIYESEQNHICSTEFQVVKPREDMYFSLIHCFLNSTHFTNVLSQKVKGTSSSHQRVNPKDIFDVKLAIPELQTLNKFNKIVDPMILKKNINHQQIQSLTKTRDTLLPKLMSGELRVEGFKK